MRNPIRMPDRIGDRNGTTLRYTQKDKAIQGRRIDHGFEIVHEVLESNVGHLAV